MTTDSTGSPRAADDPPRRSRVSTLVPFVIAALTLALIVWSAWPTVRPVRAVSVTQAVFDRSAAQSDGLAPEGADPAADSAHDAHGDASAPPSGVGQTVQAAGWLEAEPFSVAAAALADGIVESVEVLEGDRVEAGQVVARLVAIDSQLRLARAEASLASAAAELSAAEADHRAAQSAWDEPVERERAVAVNTAARAEAQAERDQLPFLIEAARANLVQYQEELVRSERLLVDHAISELDVIALRQQTAAQSATVASLEASRPLLDARVDRLAAELRAAERNLDLRIDERRTLDSTLAMAERARADLASAQTARDEAALELDRMTVRAPTTGFVQRRLKSPGDKAVRMMDDPTSAQIVILYDPSRLQARVDVPLADASHIFVGQRCEVVVEILPDTVLEGRVLRATHEADLQKNTLQVKVGLINPSPFLRPEMLTRVKFLPRGESSSADAHEPPASATTVLVPSETIDARQDPPLVWTVTSRRGDRGTAHAVPVQRLSESDGWVSVTGPLTPGALLITNTTGLTEGQRVRIAPEDPS